MKLDFRVWLVVAFLLLLGLLYARRGIVDTYDDSRYYQTLAAAIPQHFPPDAHARWYASYALTVKLLWDKNSPMLYLVQCAIAVAALLVLVTQVDRHLGRRNAWLAGLLFLLAIEWHVFHFSLMTDSLATACSLLCLLLVAYHPLRGIWWWGLPLLLFTLFLRPTNWALVPAIAAGGLAQLSHARWRWIGIGVASLAALLLGNGLLGSFDWQPTQLSGQVIFGWNDWRIAPSSTLTQPPPHLPPVLQYLHIWAQAPGWNLELLGTKLFLCLTGWRPYYSALHNSLIVGYQIPLLALGVWGLIRAPRPLSALLGTFLLAHLLANGLLSVDWENRFWFPALPVLAWLAAYAVMPRKPDLQPHAAATAHLA